jgi:hypothetical protein
VVAAVYPDGAAAWSSKLNSWMIQRSHKTSVGAKAPPVSSKNEQMLPDSTVNHISSNMVNMTEEQH